MKRLLFATVFFILVSAVSAGAWEVQDHRKVAGFGHPESVAYDPQGKALYVSRFGPELKPLAKDGQGFISKVDLTGKVIEERFLPTKGQVLHKPKGIWIADGHLWVTDIDAVWCFDLATKKGRKTLLPDAIFANDPVVAGNKLYVSDMQTGVVYLVSPAVYALASPQVSQLVAPSAWRPNGLAWHPRHGLLVACSSGIAYLDHENKPITLVDFPGGSLDGLAFLPDGSILFTDWKSHSLYLAQPGGKAKAIAKGFQGPADFCFIPHIKGFTVIMPDLVSGQLNFIVLWR